MFTAPRLIIISILLLTVIIASWSRLRYVDKEDHEPLRWRVDEHPAFQETTGN